MCDVIGPGRLSLAFLPAARLGNPLRAGVYPLTVLVGSAAFAPTLVVRPA
jgi:hypothetical protein